MANETKLATNVPLAAALSAQAPNVAVTRDDGSTTWQTVDLSAYAGRYAEVVCLDASAYVCVTEAGFATGSIVIDSASLALGDNVAVPIAAGERLSFVIGKDLNALNFRTVTADPAIWSVCIR